MPLALIAVLILSALSAALLSIGTAEVLIAGNHFQGRQAHLLAEAGLEDAFDVFRSNPAQLAAAPAALGAVPGLRGPGATLATGGSYVVRYQASGADTILVVSQGTTTAGATRTMRATLTTSFRSNLAILTKGDLAISGNPSVTGACGSAHSNADLSISGNPSLTGSATATGTFSASGSPNVGGTTGGGQAPKPIPAINPLDFLNAAKAKVAAGTIPANEVIQLKSDGSVLDGNDVVIATVESGKEFNNWKYQGGSPIGWDLSGNTGVDGTYFIEGNAKISGNPGSAKTPWRTSILATGDVEVSGNPEISTHLTDTLFVAGGDVKLSGNPTQGFNGLIAAHEQIDISGNPEITGYIIAEDAADVSQTVKENKISGNPTITYECDLNPPLPGPLQILAWSR
jgi:hypothetical protein